METHQITKEDVLAIFDFKDEPNILPVIKSFKEPTETMRGINKTLDQYFKKKRQVAELRKERKDVGEAEAANNRANFLLKQIAELESKATESIKTYSCVDATGLAAWRHWVEAKVERCEDILMDTKNDPLCSIPMPCIDKIDYVAKHYRETLSAIHSICKSFSAKAAQQLEKGEIESARISEKAWPEFRKRIQPTLVEHGMFIKNNGKLAKLIDAEFTRIETAPPPRHRRRAKKSR